MTVSMKGFSIQFARNSQITRSDETLYTKHQQPNTQKYASVRVFYLKHENKMYREPQTRLLQAQTDK